MNSQDFIKELNTYKTEKELNKVEKFFKGNDGETKALGVKFGDVFKLAKKYEELSVDEISKLLDSKFYEVRMGAVSIMAFRARNKKTDEKTKKLLYDLYIKRHDRINNWDLVDRAAHDVVGSFLIDKPRNILYKLAKSKNTWERRTAIVSTYAFIKMNDITDTFQIAEILLHDKEELINKAVGSWIREAGKRNKNKLKEFLDKYSSEMPRAALRYAVEKLSEKEKKFYLGM